MEEILMAQGQWAYVKTFQQFPLPTADPKSIYPQRLMVTFWTWTRYLANSFDFAMWGQPFLVQAILFGRQSFYWLVFPLVTKGIHQLTCSAISRIKYARDWCRSWFIVISYYRFFSSFFWSGKYIEEKNYGQHQNRAPCAIARPVCSGFPLKLF
jgi:hypothetical protein